MKKVNWNKLGLEIVSIVFAVFLALILNHWRESYTSKKSSDMALTNILVEIDSNKENLKKELKETDKKIHALDSVKKRLDAGEKGDRGFGFSMTLLSKSAWSTALATGAVESFDLAFLMDVASLYDFQEIYYQNGMNYFNTINSLEFQKEENAELVLVSTINQLKIQSSWTKDLCDGYDELFYDFPEIMNKYLPDSLHSD